MNEGVLIAKDTPSNLIKMVTNQVWELKVKEADLKEIAKKYKVSNIIAEEDGIVVRIIEKKEAIESQWNPVMVRPNLEDLYLYLFQ